MDRVNVHFEDVQEGDEITDWPTVDNISRTHFVRYAGHDRAQGRHRLGAA